MWANTAFAKNQPIHSRQSIKFDESPIFFGGSLSYSLAVSPGVPAGRDSKAKEKHCSSESRPNNKTRRPRESPPVEGSFYPYWASGTRSQVPKVPAFSLASGWRFPPVPVAATRRLRVGSGAALPHDFQSERQALVEDCAVEGQSCRFGERKLVRRKRHTGQPHEVVAGAGGEVGGEVIGGHQT